MHKAYDALDRDHCMYILELYGLGPRATRLLQRHWYQLTIVARAGG